MGFPFFVPTPPFYFIHTVLLIKCENIHQLQLYQGAFHKHSYPHKYNVWLRENPVMFVVSDFMRPLDVVHGPR